MTAKNVLYIVGTPIGNLKDISYRAIDILNSVNVIYSEDTRQTKKLLDRYGIVTLTKSYRDQNHSRAVTEILNVLKDGSACLVSDSGTPLISDPGYKLVVEVLKSGFDVVPIPGPSAVVASLSASGLPTDRFCFLGFLPKSAIKRREILMQYGNLDSTLVIYESPYRVVKLLKEVLEVLGDRQVCVAGEITKMFERFFRGNVSEVMKDVQKHKIKGEYTVLISKVLK